ncbi:MAG: PDZ domain-containing protein [Deltaproteobacteria bacterium]|nr:PDZ domain-containing protein [Deltaproteobacteria bacterium]
MKRHLTGLAVLLFSMLVVFQSPVPAQTVLVSPLSSPVSSPAGRPWIGVIIQDINPDIVETMDLKTSSGVLVSGVSAGSPAEAAGVVPGDVIIAVNGTEVLSSGELVTLIQAARPGASVVLELNRSGQAERISLVLGDMPTEASTVYTGGMMCAGCSAGMHAPPGPMDGWCMHGMTGGHGKTGMHGMLEIEKYGKMYLMALSGLDLTEDQRKKARILKSDYIKGSIRSGADIGVAEVELKELLAAEAVNLGQVKAKIKEIESKKADLRFFRIKSLEEFKKTLTPEQRKKLGGIWPRQPDAR